MREIFEFNASVWQWDSRKSDSWFFVSVPPELTEDVADRTRGMRGFGSVKVTATIGGTTWATSIFPDKTKGSYVLPLKKQVRTREGIEPESTVKVTLTVLD